MRQRQPDEIIQASDEYYDGTPVLTSRVGKTVGHGPSSIYTDEVAGGWYLCVKDHVSLRLYRGGKWWHYRCGEMVETTRPESYTPIDEPLVPKEVLQVHEEDGTFSLIASCVH